MVAPSKDLFDAHLLQRKQRNEFFDSFLKMAKLVCGTKSKLTQGRGSAAENAAIFEKDKRVMATCRDLRNFTFDKLIARFYLNDLGLFVVPQVSLTELPLLIRAEAEQSCAILHQDHRVILSCNNLFYFQA